MISSLCLPSIWTSFRALPVPAWPVPAWRASRYPGDTVAHGRYTTFGRAIVRSLSTSNAPSHDAPPNHRPTPDQPARGRQGSPPEPTGLQEPPGTPESRREDLLLVERCRGGDHSAFDLIVERYQNRIFNLCYWMLGDREEAADAAQDAFVRAFRALPNFRGDSALGTWLHRIAVNVTLDTVARRKKAPILASNLSGDDEDDSRAFDPADESATPEETSLAGERRMAVRAALASLPENHRAVLVLFDIQGHSYEEAAAALDVPLGTLKSRLSRARNALKEALESRRELFED